MVPATQQAIFRNIRGKCKTATELIRELTVLVAEDAAINQITNASLAAVGGSGQSPGYFDAEDGLEREMWNGTTGVIEVLASEKM